jgi:CheY-like chemotaxis protein
LISPIKPILYTEDDENDAFFMRHAFSRAGIPHRLVIVPDGQQAIDYLSGAGFYTDRTAHPLPAMVLLDLNLPVRSGFEVLAWIREQPPFFRLPVIIFSSSNHYRDIERARLLGADEYCVKPSEIARRIAIIHALRQRWLTEPRTAAQAAFWGETELVFDAAASSDAQHAAAPERKA